MINAETVREADTQLLPGPRPAAAVWLVQAENIHVYMVRALHRCAWIVLPIPIVLGLDSVRAPEGIEVQDFQL